MATMDSNGAGLTPDRREQEQWERFGWPYAIDIAPTAQPSKTLLRNPTVGDLLRVKDDPLVTIAPSASIATAAEIMSTRRIDLLFVSENQRSITGILSERDLIKALADMPIRPILGLKVSDLMITDVITCSREDTLIAVLDEMHTRKFRHMPVARGQNISALVSITDILIYLKDNTTLRNEECMWLRLMDAI